MFWRLINLGLHGIEIALLIAVVIYQQLSGPEAIRRGLLRVEFVLAKLLKKGGETMGQIDELKARVRAVAEGQASLEQRIDAIIDALKMPHDSPEVGQMIAELEALRGRQDGFTGDLPDNPPVEEG